MALSVVFTLLFFAAIVGVFKPYIANSKRWHFGLAAFVAFILVGVSAPSSEIDEESTALASNGSETIAADANETEVPADNSAQPALPTEKASKWVYQQDVDEMRGETSYYAMLPGTNTINLDFPYGEQRGQVLIRKSPKFGFDILVGVESGQILCSSYRDSYLNVKFDDGPIKRYSCADASDGSSNLVFLRNAKGFLAELRKADRMIVEAEFYRNGVQQLTFDTSNLEWDH